MHAPGRLTAEEVRATCCRCCRSMLPSSCWRTQPPPAGLPLVTARAGIVFESIRCASSGQDPLSHFDMGAYSLLNCLDGTGCMRQILGADLAVIQHRGNHDDDLRGFTSKAPESCNICQRRMLNR